MDRVTAGWRIVPSFAGRRRAGAWLAVVAGWLAIEAGTVGAFGPTASALRAACAADEKPPTGAPADEEDEGGEERFVVVKAGTILPVSGEEIENGTIVIVNGRIRNVGRSLEYPLNAKVIDAQDRVVMPGLINPATRMGMPRYARMGVSAHLRVSDEFVAAEGQFDDLLNAGYTTVGLIPMGVGAPGRALIRRTAGPVDRQVWQAEGYVWLNGDKKTLREAFERAKKEIEKVDKAREEFEKKQQEQAAKAAASAPASVPASQPAGSQPASAPASQPAFEPPKIDPAVEPLVGLLQKKEGLRALVEIGSASDFLLLQDLLDEFEFAHDLKARNSTQSDLEYVLGPLSEGKPQLILWATGNRVPWSAERVNLVKMFADKGCTVSLVPAQDSRTGHEDVLSDVAELIRWGLPKQSALQMLTLNPAKLLGLDAKLGAIEPGKQADLAFFEGDPLTGMARLREVMIAGEIVHKVEGLE